MNAKTITVETIVRAPIEKVWQCWNEPEHITKWAFASDDWEAPHAENDLQVGGKLKVRMSAKDQSSGFDLVAKYTSIEENEWIEYDLEDGRHVRIEFTPVSDGIKITETFEMENVYSEEMQRSGWQAILDNFKKHAEAC